MKPRTVSVASCKTPTATGFALHILMNSLTDAATVTSQPTHTVRSFVTAVTTSLTDEAEDSARNRNESFTDKQVNELGSGG